jgi:hypothetical protein
MWATIVSTETTLLGHGFESNFKFERNFNSY